MEISLIVTIALAVIAVAIAAGLWAAHRTARPVLVGLGLVLVAVGFYLTQLTRLAINGVLSIVDWAQRTAWTDTMTWGVGLLLVGVVLVGIGAALRSKPSRAATETSRPVAPATQPRPAMTGAQQRPPAAAPTPRAKPADSSGKPADPEDAEIEAILRKRGIM